jgi:hypothetical protein
VHQKSAKKKLFGVKVELFAFLLVKSGMVHFVDKIVQEGV